jgi:hypothetical protein
VYFFRVVNPFQAKKLQWKTEDIVTPRLRELGPQVAQRVVKNMAKEGVRGTKDELKTMHMQRSQQEVMILFYITRYTRPLVN